MQTYNYYAEVVKPRRRREAERRRKRGPKALAELLKPYLSRPIHEQAVLAQQWIDEGVIDYSLIYDSKQIKGLLRTEAVDLISRLKP